MNTCGECRYFPGRLRHTVGQPCTVPNGMGHRDVVAETEACNEYFSPMTKKCPDCGEEMDMYYSFWCPFCTKPDALSKTVRIYNLIQVLKWMEAHGYKGIRERVWNYLRRILDNFYNDSVICVDLVGLPGYEHECSEDFVSLCKEFNFSCPEDTYFEVSW